jgi:GNAT superfamily N-acetyltransferase
LSIRVPEGFSFGTLDGCCKLPAPVAGIQHRRWGRAFSPPLTPAFNPPLTYDYVLLALTHSLGRPCALRVYVKQNFDVKYCLIVNRGTAPLAVARREIRLERHEAFHNMLVVDPALQQGGLSSQLLANAIPLYRSLNIHRILLDAGLSAGGSVWPKFGFQPVNTATWRKIHPKIRQNMAQLDPVVTLDYRQKVGRDLPQVVDSILGLPNPSAIWAISDLDAILPGISGPRGLGSCLLSKTRWSGILCFDDRLAYGRLVTYLKKKGHFI